MAQHDEIEKDQYAKIEVLTKSVSELTGAVSVLNKTNTDLVATLRRTNFYQFLTIVFLIAVIAYGAIGVLTVRGAPAYVTGDEGTFRFQDEGGTNYFGFSKSESYVIGCDTDAISVNPTTKIVTLGYDVVMTGVPCIWYAPSLDAQPIVWEQLNNPDGTPVPGAKISETVSTNKWLVARNARLEDENAALYEENTNPVAQVEDLRGKYEEAKPNAAITVRIQDALRAEGTLGPYLRNELVQMRDRTEDPRKKEVFESCIALMDSVVNGVRDTDMK